MNAQLASAVYLQVSTISQALIFVTRSQGWSFTERPGLLVIAFIIAQLVSQLETFSYVVLEDKERELFKYTPGSFSFYSTNMVHENGVIISESLDDFLIFSHKAMKLHLCR